MRRSPAAAALSRVSSGSGASLLHSAKNRPTAMKTARGTSLARVSEFTSQALCVIPRALMNARVRVRPAMRSALPGPAFITGQ